MVLGFVLFPPPPFSPFRLADGHAVSSQLQVFISYALSDSFPLDSCPHSSAKPALTKVWLPRSVSAVPSSRRAWPGRALDTADRSPLRSIFLTLFQGPHNLPSSSVHPRSFLLHLLSWLLLPPGLSVRRIPRLGPRSSVLLRPHSLTQSQGPKHLPHTLTPSLPSSLCPNVTFSGRLHLTALSRSTTAFHLTLLPRSAPPFALALIPS